MAEFLSRWSARKAAVREGKPVAESVLEQPAEKINASVKIDTVQTEPAPAPPALTLGDVETLTPASDFSGFVAKGVDTVVKNAAMKKLFSDPHFNIMDGLDIYIGDYSTHAPMPQSVIDEMTKDGFLNMFQKEEIPEPKAPLHDDADLQLQRDDAAGREGAQPADPQLAVPPPSP